MPKFSEDFKNSLRERIDIVDFIGDYVELKRSGRTYKGRCPFHNDDTPSFTVYPDNGSFFCFGCHKGGDIINFTEEIEHLDYAEAVQFLADRAGVPMPEDNFDDTLSKKRQRMRRMNADAARFFYQYMMSSEGNAGLRYWTEKRQLSMKIIRRFGLGYAPDDWHGLKNHMNRLGYSDQELLEAGLVRKSEKNGRSNYYDNFRNRVMVPIINVRGNIIGFGGRVMDDTKPKYVNTSDTLLYHKTDEVFALNFAKDSGKDELILCEGYMDVIALHAAGFQNAVAGLGTALTDQQARLLSRYCNTIYLSYDSDSAGRAATDRALDIFQKTGLDVKVLSYSGGKDPDEIIQTYGSSRFQAILDNAENATAYRLKQRKNRYDMDTIEGKHHYLQDSMPILEKQDDTGRELYIARLSQETGVSEDAIKSQLKNYLSKKQYRESRRLKSEGSTFRSLLDKTSGGRGRAVKTREERAEELILSALMTNHDYLERVDRSLDPEDFTPGFHRKLYEELRRRIQEGSSTELIQFSEMFTPEEMAQISRPRMDGALANYSMREVEDCIAVLKKRRHR